MKELQQEGWRAVCALVAMRLNRTSPCRRIRCWPHRRGTRQFIVVQDREHVGRLLGLDPSNPQSLWIKKIYPHEVDQQVLAAVRVLYGLAQQINHCWR